MNQNKLIEDISILIAEDEAELREYLQEYLEIFFKKIYVAKCGKEAYEQYLDKKPDIIISDINMPNLDGLSMIEQIRKTDTETNIIIMSAHSEQDKLLQAIELGLVTYMIKPINSQKLKDLLFEIVEKLRGTKKRLYIAKDIFWDNSTLTLWNNKQQIFLKEKELMLLKLLCSQVNKTFKTEEIFNYLYADQTDKKFSEYAITSFIKRLRNKIPQNIIHNEYGSGYRVMLFN